METKKIIGVLLVGAIIFIPALFEGGRTNTAIVFAGIFIILYGFFQHRSFTFLTLSHPAVTLAALLLWIALHTVLFSYVPYTSARSFLPIAGGGMLFLIGAHGVKREHLAAILIVGAGLIAFIGLVFFLQSENYSYLRLSSTFYNHNGLAGFLILPTILSLWLAIKEKQYGHILSVTLSILLCTAFFLTFSRGGYISLGISLIVFFVMLARSEAHTKVFLKKISVIGVLLLFSAGAAYGIFSLKKIQAERHTSVVAQPYAGERAASGETGLRARLIYMRYALSLFREQPLVGYGLGSFASEARRVQRDVRFYSTDPHNLYFRFLAELGLIGVMFFVAFVGLVIRIGWFASWTRDANLLAGTFFAGFVGILVHNGGDVDFQFPANVFLFFLTASVLVASPKKESGASAWRVGQWVLIAIVAILVFASLFYARRSDPFTRIREAAYSFGKGNLGRAEILLKEAEILHPHEREIYLLRGTLLREKGDRVGASAAYEKALWLAPYKDLEAVFQLLALFFEDGEDKKAKTLVSEALARFPQEAFDSHIWFDPGKERIRQQRLILEKYLGR